MIEGIYESVSAAIQLALSVTAFTVVILSILFAFQVANNPEPEYTPAENLLAAIGFMIITASIFSCVVVGLGYSI
jgi:hypothetical protein